MKHPVLENKTGFIVWWLVWLFLTIGQSLLFYFACHSSPKIIAIDSFVSLLLYSGIAFSLWFPLNYFNSSAQKTTSVVSNILITGTITIGFWIITTKQLMLLMLPSEQSYVSYWNATLSYRIGSGIFIFFLIILSYYLYTSLKNLSEKNAKEAQLESLVKETELKMLRSQINPHFLFNSLNSISSLTITDPEKARTMVIRLSDFMRYSLTLKDDQPVTLSSEMDNMRIYLDIEKVRFGERLSSYEQIDKECLNAHIPVMLLQPLFENAVKHGVYESTGNVKINTKAVINEGFLEITISNNYDTTPPLLKGTGTGLRNVSRRLELCYGKKALFKTQAKDGLFTAILYIPVQYS